MWLPRQRQWAWRWNIREEGKKRQGEEWGTQDVGLEGWGGEEEADVYVWIWESLRWRLVERCIFGAWEQLWLRVQHEERGFSDIEYQRRFSRLWKRAAPCCTAKQTVLRKVVEDVKIKNPDLRFECWNAGILKCASTKVRKEGFKKIWRHVLRASRCEQPSSQNQSPDHRCKVHHQTGDCCPSMVARIETRIETRIEAWKEGVT